MGNIKNYLTRGESEHSDVDTRRRTVSQNEKKWFAVNDALLFGKYKETILKELSSVPISIKTKEGSIIKATAPEIFAGIRSATRKVKSKTGKREDITIHCTIRGRECTIFDNSETIVWLQSYLKATGVDTTIDGTISRADWAVFGGKITTHKFVAHKPKAKKTIHKSLSKGSGLHNKALYNKEALIIKNHTTLSDKQYNQLFPHKRVGQGNIGNCYLIAALQVLSKHATFKTLMKTSISKSNHKGAIIKVKFPLGEPGGVDVYITKKELQQGYTRGAVGFRVLEVAFAKYVSTYKTKVNNLGPGYLSKEEFATIAGGDSGSALKMLLGKNNISNDIIGPYKSSFTKKENELLNKVKQQNIILNADQKKQYMTWAKRRTSLKNPTVKKQKILQLLRGYDLAQGDELITVSSLQGPGGDTQMYPVGKHHLYYNHAYSIQKVHKNTRGEIISIDLLNPRNKQGNSKSFLSLSLNDFLEGFAIIFHTKMTDEYLDGKTKPSDVDIRLVNS